MLAWVRSLASLAALLASACVLWAAQAFHRALWTIRSVGQ